MTYRFLTILKLRAFFFKNIMGVEECDLNVVALTIAPNLVLQWGFGLFTPKIQEMLSFLLHYLLSHMATVIISDLKPAYYQLKKWDLAVIKGI